MSTLRVAWNDPPVSAVKGGHVDVVRPLLEPEHKADLELRRNLSGTALQNAMHLLHLEIVLLVENGANVIGGLG